MSGKKAIKKQLGVKGHYELTDVHRKTPKAKGGTYDNSDNVIAIDPRKHMLEHGNLRERSPELDALKTIFDDRLQIIRLRNKMANQLAAYERRTDSCNPVTKAWLESQIESVKPKLNEMDRLLTKAVMDLKDTIPIVAAMLGVPGVGPVTVAACLTYLQPDALFTENDTAVKEGLKRVGDEKCPHASSFWAYAGFDKPSHQRHEKGKKGGGNQTFRTVLYTMAESQMKSRGPYREIYDRTKARLEKSDRIVTTRDTAGRICQMPWCKVKPSHRHGAALRAVAKHFLADLWYVWRDTLGLSTNADMRCYAEAHLGDSHRTVDPKSRGWIWTPNSSKSKTKEEKTMEKTDSME